MSLLIFSYRLFYKIFIRLFFKINIYLYQDFKEMFKLKNNKILEKYYT